MTDTARIIRVADALADQHARRARYEPQSGPEDHHHHMIDVETGEVLEFYNQELEDLKKRIARDLGFDLVDHHLELFGTRRKKQH